mgnify:CR=1 FL=1
MRDGLVTLPSLGQTAGKTMLKECLSSVTFVYLFIILQFPEGVKSLDKKIPLSGEEIRQPLQEWRLSHIPEVFLELTRHKDLQKHYLLYHLP